MSARTHVHTDGACAGHGDTDPPVPFPRRAAAVPVRLYQAARHGRPSPCRFVPSCSTYAIEAIETHGAVRGWWLAVRRIGRCRPGGGHGVDLVPAPRSGARHV